MYVLGTVLTFLILTGNEGAVRFGLPGFEIFLREYDLRVVKRCDPHAVFRFAISFLVINHLIVYINQFSAHLYRVDYA